MIESKRSESIMNLAAALAIAQGQTGKAPKDQVADTGKFKYRYATLDGIWDACRKPLADNGLSVVQIPINDETGFCLETILLHSSGEWISGMMTLPVVAGRMSELQAMGSAITYARRYALGAMIGITVTTDDDGQQASKRKIEATPEPQILPVQSFPNNKPVKGEFFKRAQDAGFEPSDAAAILKAAGFDGYASNRASDMWAAIITEYEARKAAQLDVGETTEQPMPQAQAVQPADDDELPKLFPEIFPEPDATQIEDQPF